MICPRCVQSILIDTFSGLKCKNLSHINMKTKRAFCSRPQWYGTRLESKTVKGPPPLPPHSPPPPSPPPPFLTHGCLPPPSLHLPSLPSNPSTRPPTRPRMAHESVVATSKLFPFVKHARHKKKQILADFVNTIGCDRATLMFVDTPSQVRRTKKVSHLPEEGGGRGGGYD